MPRPQANRRRTAILLAALGLPGVALLALAAAVWWLNQPTGASQVREIDVQAGMSARGIGELLRRQELIRSARLFEWTARWQDLDHRLEAGTYQLDGAQTTAGIVRRLLKAPIRTRRVTIPEGLTRLEVAGLLQRRAQLDSARVADLTADPGFIRQLGVDAPTLEGYLFPETYFLDPDATEVEVIERMVAELRGVFADSLHQRLEDLGLTLHQAITLASIVEREAVVAEERPIISQVFQRRLRLNRLLESCATVEYALGVHKRRLTNRDLRVESPFNTYRHRGLPPGPIGNPGEAALLAALYPADTDYLYFVARGDGHHIFSRTHAEHTRAKRSIRIETRRRARQLTN